MDVEINTQLLAILTPVILGFVQLLKMSVGPDRKWLPWVNIALGLIGGLLLGGLNASAVMSGITASFSAMGLWSGGKAVMNQ